MKAFPTFLLAVFLSSPALAREAPQSALQAGSPSTTPAANGKQKAIPSFLILGTVFNENGLSFPGVEVRVKPAGGKKFLWETYTNSRGEFAVRVPPGAQYEVQVHVKKYLDQAKNVDATVDVQQRLSIQLQPADQTKTGAKP